jgi:hypothetical protein
LTDTPRRFAAWDQVLQLRRQADGHLLDITFDRENSPPPGLPPARRRFDDKEQTALILEADIGAGAGVIDARGNLGQDVEDGAFEVDSGLRRNAACQPGGRVVARPRAAPAPKTPAVDFLLLALCLCHASIVQHFSAGQPFAKFFQKFSDALRCRGPLAHVGCAAFTRPVC